MKKLNCIIALLLLFTSLKAQWIMQASNTNANLRSVYFTSPGHGHIASQLGGYGGNLNTTDGINWTDQLISFAPYYSIFFLNADTGYMTGPFGNLAVTTDAGTNWSGGNMTTPSSSYILYDICFVNDTTGFIGSTDVNIHKTTNAGASWTPSPVTGGYSSLFFTSSTTGYAAGSDQTFAYRGVIAKTIDQGATWSEYFLPGVNTQLHSIHFPSANTGFAAGDYTVVRTTDAGATWNELNVDTTVIYNDVFFFDNNIGYLVGTGGSIFKTTDGGNNWTTQVSGTTQILHSIYCTDANTCYAVGDSGVILKTTNGGVGMNDISFVNDIASVSPNPFNSTASIHITGQPLQDAILHVYDITGREVNAINNLKGNEILLQRNDLHTGLYFFTITQKGIPCAAGKMIIE